MVFLKSVENMTRMEAVSEEEEIEGLKIIIIIKIFSCQKSFLFQVSHFLTYNTHDKIIT